MGAEHRPHEQGDPRGTGMSVRCFVGGPVSRVRGQDSVGQVGFVTLWDPSGLNLWESLTFFRAQKIQDSFF